MTATYQGLRRGLVVDAIPPIVLPPAPKFDVDALIKVFAELEPVLLTRLLTEHVPDRTGHCAGCRDQVPPRSPCTIRVYAAAGQQVTRDAAVEQRDVENMRNSEVALDAATDPSSKSAR